MRNLSIACILAATALPLPAQVYQCRDSSGQLTFSDTSCNEGQSGALVQRKRSDEEIHRERMEAAEANERKARQQVIDLQQRQIEAQQRTLEQQARSTAPSPALSASSQACQQARKELEFVSSIRTLPQDEKRLRTNAAITNVNAACGSSTPLIQEPAKLMAAPYGNHPIALTDCSTNLCHDSLGSTYQRSGQLLYDSQGRNCQMLGSNMVQCP